MQIIRKMSTAGLLLGTLFFAFSLSPSLLPRPFLFQGIVSGLSLTAGYALGAAGLRLWSYLELPVPGERVERIVKLAATAFCTVVAAAFLWRASEWQNTLRTMMGMEEAGGVQHFSVALVALFVFGAALLIAWLFRRIFLLLSGKLRRVVPRRVSNVIGAVAAVALFWTIIDGVIFTQVLRVADGSYRQVDALVPDEMDRPVDPMKSGSADSFISWRDLGRQGRAFVTAGPSAEEIGAFNGTAALEPIRVYVGLNAADTPEARARLALRELERVGAFERSVLLLVTPTGTGWVDPAALDPLEYLHRGDVASVAAQYSYLPSPLALIVEGAYGAENARALFEEVYDHWTALPRESRPKLYLHGASLGALNSDLSFDLHDILADLFHGALWSGPPFRMDSWIDVVRGREPDSPAWLPRFRDGSVVRFMNQNGGLEAPGSEWGPLRLAYLQYASDPITFFSVGSFFREPEWMREPRGPDVSPELRWYPIVTALQLAADMATGAEASPPGFGHNFAAEHYIDAWLALTEPEGWNDEEIVRLKSHVASRQVTR
jgi:uncharacterized membrane protein